MVLPSEPLLMIRQLSLKGLFTLAFLAIGLVIVIGYSLLSLHFFVRGMDNIVSANMENAALTFLASQREFDEKGQADFRGNQLSATWQNQPANIQAAFNTPPQIHADLKKQDPSRWFKRPDEMFFVMKVTVENDSVYISRTVTRESMSQTAGRNANESMRLLLLFSGIIALTMAGLIWFILRHISQPVARLGRWTRSLKAENLQQPPPDFLYPELNDMAVLIQRSLSSVQKGLQREHQFLRYTSHELRTPISVIRNNIELLHKLQAQPNPQNSDMRQAIADRIDRASRTMQHLTETLLWLSRDTDEKLNETEFDLQDVLHQLCDEMRYLLKDKQVVVELTTEKFPCTAAEIVVRIVLGNLIRNAYQHTWEGRVTITQQANRVQIINQQHTNEPATANDAGFGLGLQLTEQLCHKLGWYYQNQPTLSGHDVTLVIGFAKAPSDNAEKTV